MRRTLVIASVAALLLGVITVPSIARPGEIHAKATAVYVETLDPGESWFKGDVNHVRGVVWRVRVEGTGDNAQYQTGDQISEINFNWNWKTGALNSWGTVEITLDAMDGGYAGTWVVAGPPNPDAVGGECAAWSKFTGVGKGFGDLEGAQVRWDNESDMCGFVSFYDAAIFFPGG